MLCSIYVFLWLSLMREFLGKVFYRLVLDIDFIYYIKHIKGLQNNVKLICYYTRNNRFPSRIHEMKYYQALPFIFCGIWIRPLLDKMTIIRIFISSQIKSFYIRTRCFSFRFHKQSSRHFKLQLYLTQKLSLKESERETFHLNVCVSTPTRQT